MKAVITAGGRIDGPFARDAGTNVKALAPVRGATMLARMIEALRANGATQIAVVGGSEVRAACNDVVEQVIDESPSGSTNLLLALRAWPEDGEPLLYATSDLPYVTGESVAAFLNQVPSGSLAIPLTEVAARIGLTPARSSAVNTAPLCSSGMVTDRSRACAKGLRTNATSRVPGMRKSATYWPRPRSSPASSDCGTW